MSNLDMFKYEWVWEKDNGTNFTSVNWQPFRVHEHVLIFGYGATTFTKTNNYMKYNPQKTKGKPYKCKSGNSERPNLQGSDCSNFLTINSGDRHPRTIQKFKKDKEKLHPTQKPVKLFEYLIKTYTNEGDVVLDCCAGSFTTAIACINTNRKYICIEKDKNYYSQGKERIRKHINEH
jgi:site-specific DNA-methyltransferase (adenine-specific)